MGIFSKDNKTKNYLGIDIGGSSVKMVELTDNKGRAQLVTYGFLERSLKSDQDSLLNNPQEMASALKKVAQSAGVKSNQAVTALPASAVFSTIINIPNFSRKDLSSNKKITEAIEKEAQKVLPLPLDEMILDWKILGLGEEDSEKAKIDGTIKNLQILLTAAAKSLVQKYVEIFKMAGIELKNLETESFAMARALVGKDKSTVIIVDIGSANTDISIVENSVPYMERTVNFGGFNITKILSDKLNISIEQAEQFKRDLINYSDRLPDGKLLPPEIEKSIVSVINEIKYLIDFYKKQKGENSKIDRIILSGGTAKLFNLSEYFSQVFNIRTFLGDPWARVIYPDDLKPHLETIGSRLAVCVGLGMRELDK